MRSALGPRAGSVRQRLELDHASAKAMIIPTMINTNEPASICRATWSFVPPLTSVAVRTILAMGHLYSTGDTPIGAEAAGSDSETTEIPPREAVWTEAHPPRQRAAPAWVLAFLAAPTISRQLVGR